MDALEQSVLLDLFAFGESEGGRLGVDMRVLHRLEAAGLVCRTQEYRRLGRWHRPSIWAITDAGRAAVGRA